MSGVTFSIDGMSVTAQDGASVLDAARAAGMYIPGLCSHPSLPVAQGKNGLPSIWRDSQVIQSDASGTIEFHGCGLCSVEVDGEIVQACATTAREGLRIQSQSAHAKAARQDRLAEILADHPHTCLTCPNREGCDRIACSFNVPVPERCCTKFSNCELRKVADYIGIKSDTPREVGSLIYLQFTLQDGSKLIEGLGRVVRVSDGSKDGLPGMGVEFVNFDSESMALIEQICGA